MRHLGHLGHLWVCLGIDRGASISITLGTSVSVSIEVDSVSEFSIDNSRCKCQGPGVLLVCASCSVYRVGAEHESGLEVVAIVVIRRVAHRTKYESERDLCLIPWHSQPGHTDT